MNEFIIVLMYQFFKSLVVFDIDTIQLVFVAIVMVLIVIIFVAIALFLYLRWISKMIDKKTQEIKKEKYK